MESDCGMCGKYNSLLILNQQEQVLLGKLFRCISLNPHSNYICKNCLNKLYYFKNYLKEILINQVQIFSKKNMGDNSEKHTDKYNCRCINCLKKFGSLPLLVDVIEQNETEPQPSTSKEISSNRKLMKCTHCDKTFSHKGDYNKHLRKHTGEQPFNCTICDRKFAHTSNLARHMRLHSGDKPFICENCKKNFSRKDKLDLHKKTCKTS